MMRSIGHQLRKRWSLSTSAQSNSLKRPTKPHLQLEELETRLTPSTDLLSHAATPDFHVINSGSASSSVAPAASLPGGFGPQQISQAYGFNQITFSNGSIKGDGSGQTIAIIDAYNQPNITSDLATFDSTYGLAAPPKFTVVNETGGTSLPASDTNWGVEESLDVEWAHAMAPGANILLVEANSANLGDLMTAVNYARNQSGVSVISMSWGGSEWAGETSYDSYFTTPSGHNGVTFIASTGDSGSAGAPEYGSISPNVLAVGGTQLSTDSSGNYLSETGWSGSGGGISAYESRPSYQPSTYSNGSGTGTSSMRMVPDVAYNGSSNSPFAIYDTSGYGGWLQVYGTSAGAPQWAALVAIADQGRAINNQSTLDGPTQTLPAIYQVSSSDFHDITTGSNGGYTAGVGYDLVTGRGSPVANSLASDLVSYGTKSPPPPSQGPWIVTPASATPNPVTGTTTNLSVLGGDSGGASSLTYTWSVLSEPSGVQGPTFSINGSNAASNTTAKFYGAGNYTFEATITDTSGLSVTSSTTVTVNQTLTSIVVAPGTATVNDGATQQFGATAEDQFGNSISTQPGFTWSLTSGSGTLSSNGMYTAPSTGTGTAAVKATANGMASTASVTFGAVPAAPTNLTATVISTNQVNLAWTDNNSNATGEVVQRSTNGANWNTIAKLSATATSYSDTSVRKGQTYSYRVYAYNSFGNSPYSNVVSVTISGTGGGGGGGKKNGQPLTGHHNAGSLTQPEFLASNTNWQQSFNGSWIDAQYVDSLLSSISTLWTHHRSDYGDSF
jgi:subtilase family serine protease